MRTTPDGVLMVHAVTVRPVGEGSLVEVLLFDPWRGAKTDIQGGYDLVSLGEVEDIHGPFCNPPRWMITYRGKVSAKYGDRIQPKDQKTNQAGLEIQQNKKPDHLSMIA